MKYKDYLKTFHWLKTKTRIYGKYKKCFFCGNQYDLNIHHITYKTKAGKSILFKESENVLLVFCNPCHKKWHKLTKKRKFKVNFYYEIRKLFNKYHSLTQSFKLVKKELFELYEIKKPLKIIKEKPKVSYTLKKINGKWEAVDNNGIIIPNYL